MRQVSSPFLSYHIYGNGSTRPGSCSTPRPMGRPGNWIQTIWLQIPSSIRLRYVTRPGSQKRTKQLLLEDWGSARCVWGVCRILSPRKRLCRKSLDMRSNHRLSRAPPEVRCFTGQKTHTYPLTIGSHQKSHGTLPVGPRVPCLSSLVRKQWPDPGHGLEVTYLSASLGS